MPIIPVEEAVGYMKEAATKTYFAKGEEVVARNLAAIDAGSEGLNEIVIPDSVKYIEDRAFYGCISLEEIHMHNRNPREIEINAYDQDGGGSVPAFEDACDDCTLFVPPGTVNLYRKHTAFGKFEYIEEDNAPYGE